MKWFLNISILSAGMLAGFIFYTVGNQHGQAEQNRKTFKDRQEAQRLALARASAEELDPVVEHNT